MEIRGIWITNTDSKVLTTQQRIAEALDFLADTGFNVIFPVVWNKGYTLYPSQVMREKFGIEIDERYRNRNPLAEIITEAKRVGIQVIPWFEYGLMSSYNQNGGHLLAKQPAWAARDSSGNLLKKNNFEWMNTFDQEVQEFFLSLIQEVVKNYAIDGVQCDDHFALPSEGGYDQKTVALYRQQFNQEPPQNHKDWQWLRWRADRVTDFLARLYQEVKRINPDLVVSLSPSPYKWGLIEYLQDMKTWVDRKVVDWVHPQLYRRDFNSYRRLVDQLVAQQFTSQQLAGVFPGILLVNRGTAYRISPDHLFQVIAYNRSVGIQGEVFFFYEGLRDNNDELAKVLRKSFYS